MSDTYFGAVSAVLPHPAVGATDGFKFDRSMKLVRADIVHITRHR